MDRLSVNVKVSDVQADEIWGFVAKKEAPKGPEEFHALDNHSPAPATHYQPPLPSPSLDTRPSNV